MPADAGRARPYIVAALVAAFVLMGIAIAVAILSSMRPVADASPTRTAGLSLDAMPTARPTPMPTARPTPMPTASSSGPIEPSSTPTARPLIVPAAIAARPALPFCGHETVNRLPEGDFYDPAPWDCLLQARETGQAAEIIRDALTIEGGHVREIFRLRPGGQLEWWTDMTEDPLSARQWTRALCEDLVTFSPDPAGTPLYLPEACGSTEILIRPDEAGVPMGDEMAMLEDLVLFARSPDEKALNGVPLSGDGVWIGLAEELMVRRTPEELADPAAWTLDAEAFRGRVGPFSALDLLADWDQGQNAPPVREAMVIVGDHPHCASPQIAAPGEVADLRRLSIQPIGPDSCLTWWTVDLFIGPDGSIHAITLDLYEP
jgi:hypothetical protein